MLITYTSSKEAFEQENKQQGRKKKSAMQKQNQPWQP
jgi:hypothetical protein